MAVNKKNIMTRYFFVILLMALIGVAIVVKAGITMFAERQYWQDVADRHILFYETVSHILPNDNTGRMWLTVS